MRRAAHAGAAAAIAGLVALLAPSSVASSTALALGPIVRITTPGTSLCPAEGEPEVTRTRLGIWVAYNDDHQCPWLPSMTRIEEVQLVPAQGRPTFIPLDAPAGQLVGGDPDLTPGPDGGVYVSTLWSGAPGEGSLSVHILRIDSSLHVSTLPTPSFHKSNNSDDKEFIAVDRDPKSPYFGRLYVVWDDFDLAKTVLRAWDGKRWSKPVMLEDGIGAPDVAVGPGGTVAVAMEGPNGGDALVRISHTGGGHFGKPITAIRGGGDPGFVDPSCPLRPTVGVRQRAMLGARVAFDADGDIHVVAATGAYIRLSTDAISSAAVVRHAVVRNGRVVHSERVTSPTSDEQWAGSLAALPTGGIAVSWLQTNGAGRDTYDAWAAVEPAGARHFASPQRLSLTSSKFPAAMEAVGNSNCYGIGDYIGMTTTPSGVAAVWPTTDTDTPGVDSDVLLRTATPR
jgi:hypothetical protein